MSYSILQKVLSHHHPKVFFSFSKKKKKKNWGKRIVYTRCLLRPPISAIIFVNPRPEQSRSSSLAPRDAIVWENSIFFNCSCRSIRRFLLRMKYTIEPAKRKPFDCWVVFLFSSYFCEMKREKKGGKRFWPPINPMFWRKEVRIILHLLSWERGER